jgi:hypothetical protein
MNNRAKERKEEDRNTMNNSEEEPELATRSNCDKYLHVLIVFIGLLLEFKFVRNKNKNK